MINGKFDKVYNIQSEYILNNYKIFNFNGEYCISTFYNKNNILQLNLFHKNNDYIFIKGSVLYINKPEIKEYIKYFINLTNDINIMNKPKITIFKNHSRYAYKINVCEYDNNIFTIYSKKVFNEKSKYLFFVKKDYTHKIFFKNKIDEFGTYYLNSFLKDDVCCFSIIDKNTNILNAFGIYN